MAGSSVFAFDQMENRILLVKRRDVPVWVLPGGKIEQNETPLQAAIRETKEESGFDVKITRKVAEYSYNSTKTQHLFKAKVIGGKPQLNKEAKEISFFKLDTLPEIRHPFISDWITDLQKNSPRVIKRNTKEITISDALSKLQKHRMLVCRFLLTKLGIHINT
jgi:8-oxo-dGTP pyrophosphatase MutT (NUDIX family)